MLRNIKTLQGYAIHATDGVIGSVADMYFDDERWAIRYLVVDTGGWLSGRKVLISPHAMGRPDWMARVLPVSLTKAQVQHSPDIDTDKPVSRQHEAEYLGYYAYPYYWGGVDLWGLGAYPGHLTTLPAIEAEVAAATGTAAAPVTADSHLRSCKTVAGYYIHASDGDIGHVETMLVDDTSWAIRYLVVNTSNWWVGHTVLVSPKWIESIDWSTSRVTVDLTRAAIQSAPAYDADADLDREAERAIYDHYGRTGY
jgi:hypothetical protein